MNRIENPTNTNPKTETPLAHLDVDKVADMLIAVYDLRLDNEYNIVDAHAGYMICDYEPLVEYLAPSNDCPIDIFDNYNAQWLYALFMSVRLKLMCKTVRQSTYVADKLQGIADFFKDLDYDHENAVDSISDSKERNNAICRIYDDYTDYIAGKYPAMAVDDFSGYWDIRNELVNEK